MADHKLKKGIGFIEGLISLGKKLSYHTETEFPVSDDNKRAPAVDVAWFKEKGQRFPLFIFEVESVSTNSMAYNPTKVYAKPNEKFEKPLFYFQVIVEGGSDSARVDDLRRLFGSHNYRVYRLSTDERFALILDLLTQHRRLTQEIDFVGVCNFLFESGWIEMDWPKFINHFVELNFQDDTDKTTKYLTELSAKEQHFVPFFVNRIIALHQKEDMADKLVPYRTFFGAEWYFHIHAGIIFSFTTEYETMERSVRQLYYCQDHLGGMVMLKPAYGQSMDHDMFLIWTSGGLLGLLAMLFKGRHEVRLYLARILLVLVEPLGDIYRMVIAIWLMHIVPDNPEGRLIYDKMKSYFEEFDGFSNDLFLNPTLEVHYEDGDFFEKYADANDPVPSFDESRSRIAANLETEPSTVNQRIMLACEYLTSDYIENGGRKIMRMLHI